MFSPLPITISSYGAEICLPLAQLIGHISDLIEYIEMSVSHHTCSFEFFYSYQGPTICFVTDLHSPPITLKLMLCLERKRAKWKIFPKNQELILS